MTSARTLDASLLAKAALAALALGMGLALASPARAQAADTVITSARAAGTIGEQADGYLGVASGQTASADLRARVDQINIRRRAEYQSRATRNGASVNEMAASTACVLFRTRITSGERYRDESGTWRQVSAGSPVAVPSFCPPN